MNLSAKAIIYFFTGTGNSLWVARTLAKELNVEVAPIPDGGREERAANAKVIGLVFPVHIWGVPARMIQFIQEGNPLSPDYIFAIAVNAGQVANTLVQLKKLLLKNGLKLSSGFEIKLPSNYIPWGGPGPEEEQKRLFEAAREKISRIAACVKGKEIRPVEKGPLWQRFLFTLLYRLSFSRVPKMDRKFWVDDRCSQCTICSKVCPSLNIAMQGGKPTWNRRCEQCFACLQWCPQEAIQYGKKTPAYDRYHHPEVQLSEILKPRKGNGH